LNALAAKAVDEELHIASMVVHAPPARLAGVFDQIKNLPGACIHGTSGIGKLVVTLETSSAEEMSQRVMDIQRMDGVFSAALVYQCADRLEVMNEELPNAQA
jgi:periplasmic nitrate reductase NapD